MNIQPQPFSTLPPRSNILSSKHYSYREPLLKNLLKNPLQGVLLLVNSLDVFIQVDNALIFLTN